MHAVDAKVHGGVRVGVSLHAVVEEQPAGLGHVVRAHVDNLLDEQLVDDQLALDHRLLRGGAAASAGGRWRRRCRQRSVHVEHVCARVVPIGADEPNFAGVGMHEMEG